jgi:carboxymethylenebutenolidase
VGDGGWWRTLWSIRCSAQLLVAAARGIGDPPPRSEVPQAVRRNHLRRQPFAGSRESATTPALRWMVRRPPRASRCARLRRYINYGWRMIIAPEEYVDLKTSYGSMRTYVLRPAAPGRYPGLVLFSEIFQVTGPIRRTAAFLAGHGYAVAVPEIFHELEEDPGVVLAYDTAGAERGNSHKITKELASYDADARAVLDFLADHPSCTGKLGSIGICVGGHLSFRAAFNPDVRAAACFYATDIHKRGLGQGMNDDSLDRVGEIRGELLMMWGRQDPHIPREGRERIHAALEDAGTRFSWVEVNGQHAFGRDEGLRYDPELARQCLGHVLDLFHRRLGQGDEQVAAASGPVETRH